MNEISTDSTAADPRRQPVLTTTLGTNDNNSTFIVTDPGSDIETDAVPDAPRSRGTPISETPKPTKVNDEPPLTEDIPKTNGFFKGSTSRKIPGGFSKNRMPRASGGIINIVNSHGVHIGNNNVFVSKHKKQEDEVSPPKYYEILLSSTKRVNDDHLDCVAANIGENWEKLGKELGLKNSAIFCAKEDYRENFREGVYQLLLEWKQSTGGPYQAPLLSRLSLVLWQLRERDALDGLLKLESDPRL